MPRYNTLDYRANVSELDPCLAAKIRLKGNRGCNWKFVGIGIGIALVLLLIIGVVLYFTLAWGGTGTNDSPYVVKFPLDQPPVVNGSAPLVLPVQDSVTQNSKSLTLGRRLPPETLELINTSGKVFETCEEYLSNGFTQSGVYRLYRPSGYDFSAQCVMDDEDGKAWMVMQKRTSGELKFWDRIYDEYVEGFGAPSGDHWLGLKQVRDLLDAGNLLQLKVEIEGERCEKKLDNLYYVGTWNFEIGSSINDYRLRVSELLSGNFTDPLYNIANSNSLPFNKVGPGFVDSPNCMEKLHLGGWWSITNGCTFISLNGEYTCDRKDTLYAMSVYIRRMLQYGTFKFSNIRPRSTRMMLHVCNGEEKCSSPGIVS